MRTLAALAIVALVALVGCRDSDERRYEPPPPTQEELRIKQVREWLDMIDEAGLSDHADLGRTMLAEGRIEFVTPPTPLPSEFNAWADLREPRRVLLNEPLWERYPDTLDRATILLHELIHIRSGEQTHRGPWWSAQTEFRRYWDARQ
jgi:hypothetical protein